MITKKRILNFSVLLSYLLCTTALGQDLERAYRETKQNIKDDPFSISGSIGANSVGYQAYGIQPRRDPFYLAVNANLNVNLFNKISVPFSAIITQRGNNSYTNGLDRFNKRPTQLGVSPRYKFLTVHAGFRSVEFSDFSLSGALFLGGGLEIKPQNSLISGAAVFGRFVKAVPYASVDGIIPGAAAYERRGGAARLRVGEEENFGEFIIMKIRDDINSIPFDTALTVTPQENQIMAFNTRQRIGKTILVSGEFAFSFLTKNLYEQEKKLEDFTYINEIYTPRPSSQFNKAANFSIDFNPGKVRFGLRYKRIGPDYRSLGSVFLTNDVEEVSASSSVIFFKNKMNLSFAGGLQQNNLDKVQIVTSRRIIGSCNVSCNVNQHLNLGATYSSFSSNTLPVRDVFTDSVKFVQLTQNCGANACYAFQKATFLHQLTNNTTYQQAGINKIGSTIFFNETLCYNLNISEYGLSLSLSYLYNKNSSPGFSPNTGLGPNIGVQKTFYKNRIRIMLNGGYQDIYLGGEEINKNFSSNLGINIIVDKRQSLRADCSYLTKTAVAAGAQQFVEIRGSLGYLYNFGFKPKQLLKDVPKA